jgi:hypothetical protein
MRRLCRFVSLGNRFLKSTLRCVRKAAGQSRSSTLISGLGVESIGAGVGIISLEHSVLGR